MAESVIVLEGAREFLSKHGQIQGRLESDLLSAVKQTLSSKKKSASGTVATLCTSPINGSRRPCDVLSAFQSVVGDCQHESGSQAPQEAKIKNAGALLGDTNVFLESLLCAVSLGDEEIVHEVVRGLQPPRLEKVWVTGDNVYVSRLDLSWDNFHIGDLLVIGDTQPSAVIVNTGYPHSACWKYGARAGNDPKNCVNSKDGNALRMRGIKGAFLLPVGQSAATIHINDKVEIVRQGTARHKSVLQNCRTPLQEGTELVFTLNGKSAQAKANDTQAYFDLLICAGMEAGRIDQEKYKRNRCDIELQELGLQDKPMEISDAAKSGDGTIQNVGIKMNGKFKSLVTNQAFDTQEALDLHLKYLHDPQKAPTLEE